MPDGAVPSFLSSSEGNSPPLISVREHEPAAPGTRRSGVSGSCNFRANDFTSTVRNTSNSSPASRSTAPRLLPVGESEGLTCNPSSANASTSRTLVNRWRVSAASVNTIGSDGRHAGPTRHALPRCCHSATPSNLPPQLLDRRTLLFGIQNPLLHSPRSRTLLPTDLLPGGLRRRFGIGTLFLDLAQQAQPRGAAIDRLGPRILHRHARSARHMSQRHRGGNLIHMLTARTAAPGEFLLEILLSQLERGDARQFGCLKILRCHRIES